MNLWVVFLTGLTTGGLTCLAMQGGLLASVIANQKSPFARRSRATEGHGGEDLRSGSFDALDWMPVGMFLIAKLISHTALGFLLGMAGSVLTLSLPVRLFFQTFAAVFMLGTAMNLLQVHPIFRYIVLQPPKFMQRWVRHSTKSKALFAPALLGFLTVLVPCGVTQAMEVVAITSGNPVVGALTMFIFVLGTSPLFALVGIATAKFSEFWRERFLKTAAVILILMAVYGVNGVLAVMDSPVTLQKIGVGVAKVLLLDQPNGATKVDVVDGLQKVTINVTNRGYSPTRLQVNQGVPVQLTVKSNGAYSCASAFTFNQYKLFAQLKPVDEKTFRFIPDEKGIFTFACAMGMYTGTMEVI